MTTESWKEQVFEELDPPPGGLADLRERIAQQEEPRERRSLRPALRWTAGFGALVAAAAVLLLIIATRSQIDNSPEAEIPSPLRIGALANSHPALVSHGLAPAPEQPVIIASSQRQAMAALQVPLDRQDVVFYWVSSAQPPSAENGATVE